MNIIIADDEPLALEMTCEAVREVCPEANIYPFSKPSRLLEFAKETRCKIAFLDICMRGVSGIDVAKQLKDRKARRVIVCTTFGLFTDGLEKFDEYYEKGYIYRVITTNLNYRNPDLLNRPYYLEADMSKYLASIIDIINHDVSVEKVRSSNEKIMDLMTRVNGQ